MRDINDYTAKYFEDHFETRYMVKYRRKKILEIMDAHKPKNILEIGCGLEPLFKFYRDFDSYTVTEPSAEFCDNARALAENLPSKIKIINAFFEDCTLEKNFDFIILSSLLHEVEQPDKLLAAIINVATEKTLIHINVPNAKSFHRLLALKAGLIKDVHDFSAKNKKFQQHNVWDMDGLKEFIGEVANQNNRRVEFQDSESFFVKPFTHAQMEQCLNNGVFGENVLDGLDKMIEFMPELGAEIYVNCRFIGE